MDEQHQAHEALAAAVTNLTNGHYHLGLAMFLRAETLMVKVTDPIAYLSLTLRADRIVQQYFLPSGRGVA